MKLRLKVLLILAGMWILISACIFAYSFYHLTDDYLKLERAQLTDELDRTQKLLNSMMSTLDVLNADWSHWDDTYQFMQNKNPAFITSNINSLTFENAKINLILFFGPDEKLFYGQYYDLITHQFLPIPKDLLACLESNNRFIKARAQNRTGLLKVGEGYIVISALPILNSAGTGPAIGTLIMGYFVTNAHIEKLSQITNNQIKLYPFPLPPKDKKLHGVYDQLATGAKYVIASQSYEIINGFAPLRDIQGKMIGILNIEAPRTIYHKGIATIVSYLIIVFFAGIAFLFAVWFLIKKYILDRITDLSHQIVGITDEHHFSQRIKVSGQDEIDEMIKAFNALLNIIDASQEQLKHRISMRTEELERLANLNKNLYTEMNSQKNIETNLRKDEKILRHMAYYDNLTNLPNRLYFHEILSKIIAGLEKTGGSLAVLFIDADKFKSINDIFGHDIGDKFLAHIAKQLKSVVKETDISARLAGDEFILCLMNIQGKPAINKVVEKILATLSQPMPLDHLEIQSTFSIGISLYPENAKTIEELEKQADLAMYYAKRLPGNAYFYYDQIEPQIT